MGKSRDFSLDLLRAFACYMVIQIHVGGYYYMGYADSILYGDNVTWVNIYNSLSRAAVPLFVLLTGYFVLPVNLSLSDFLKKRLTRIVIPFILWCTIYALFKYLNGEVGLLVTLKHIASIPINYGVKISHLWYIYMLIGLYLVFPLISHSLNVATRGSLHFYLGLWGVTLLLPYIHLFISQLWGECYWNSTPMLYYFCGFLGFAILGFYLRKFCSERSRWDLPFGASLVVIGYLVTVFIFDYRLHSESVQTVPGLELSWGYDTINVAMMTLGFFLLFKNIKNPNNTFITNLVTDISKMSFGMYLVHILVLGFVHSLLNDVSDTAAVKIPLITFVTFIVSYIVIKLLSYIPKSKYLIG